MVTKDLTNSIYHLFPWVKHAFWYQFHFEGTLFPWLSGWRHNGFGGKKRPGRFVSIVALYKHSKFLRHIILYRNLIDFFYPARTLRLLIVNIQRDRNRYINMTCNSQSFLCSITKCLMTNFPVFPQFSQLHPTHNAIGIV